MAESSSKENEEKTGQETNTSEQRTQGIQYANNMEAVGMLSEKKPTDKYHLVYLILLLHGVGTLMPWNMFITIAPAYFVDYKLMEVTPSGIRKPTTYSLNFFSYLGICSQLPCLLMNLLNIFIQVKGGLIKRIAVALMVVALICAITIALVVVDTSQMVTAFFVITMITVIILNGANGIYQNSVFGLVSAFPQIFTNAIVLGNNLCGTFVSSINILSLLISDTIKTAAFAYFSIALLTVGACFSSLFVLPKLEFYTYYQEKAAESSREIDLDKPQDANNNKIQLFAGVFKKVWTQCMNVFLVFFVTLTIFPAIMADVRIYREDGKYDFFIPEKLFTPITTFLLFNLLAMIGSTVANFVQWPKPRYLCIPVMLRISLIPLMMFCNYRAMTRSWPVYFTNEYVYFLMAIIMSFTNGYFSSLAMMYAPKSVDSSKAAVAGMMAAFFLIFGICSGVAFTFFVSYFTDYWGPNVVIP